MHVARSVVVGIKEVSVLWNFCAISRDEFFQDKSFEKPRGMREMPFGRADVGHGLYDAIFRFKTSAQRVRELSDLMKPIPQAFQSETAREEKDFVPPPPRRRRFQLRRGLKDFLPLDRVLPGALRAFDRELLPLCLQSRDALQQFPLPECRDAECGDPWNWR